MFFFQKRSNNIELVSRLFEFCHEYQSIGRSDLLWLGQSKSIELTAYCLFLRSLMIHFFEAWISPSDTISFNNELKDAVLTSTFQNPYVLSSQQRFFDWKYCFSHFCWIGLRLQSKTSTWKTHQNTFYFIMVVKYIKLGHIQVSESKALLNGCIADEILLILNSSWLFSDVPWHNF